MSDRIGIRQPAKGNPTTRTDRSIEDVWLLHLGAEEGRLYADMATLPLDLAMWARC